MQVKIHLNEIQQQRSGRENMQHKQDSTQVSNMDIEFENAKEGYRSGWHKHIKTESTLPPPQTEKGTAPNSPKNKKTTHNMDQFYNKEEAGKQTLCNTSHMLTKDNRGDYTIVDRGENKEGQVTPVQSNEDEHSTGTVITESDLMARIHRRMG